MRELNPRSSSNNSLDYLPPLEFERSEGFGQEWLEEVAMTPEEEILFDFLLPHRRRNPLKCSDGTVYSDFIASSLAEHTELRRK